LDRLFRRRGWLLIGLLALSFACGDDGGTGATSAAGGHGGSTSSREGGGGQTSMGGNGFGGVPSQGGGGSTGEGGMGGSPPTQPGPPGNTLVSAGDYVTSQNYKLVFTMGQSTQNQSKMTSRNYRLQGGLIGATGSLP
jgi:hypothetical protein